MSDGSANQGDPKQSVSALADGELDAASVQRLCAAWRDDPSVRSTWHAYHLIGDVLRSEDLASRAGHDEAFLASLRSRLADEPVVLAPQPLPPSAPPAREASATPAVRRRAWVAPFAVAAGFMAVAGVLVVTQVSAPTGAPAALVAAVPRADSPAPRAVAASPGPGAVVGGEAVAVAAPSDLKLVRDARLDRYLAAHKQFDRGAPVSVPGVMLRNAAAYAPER